MTNANHADGSDSIIDRVDYPMVADANTPQIAFADELPDSVRSRM